MGKLSKALQGVIVLGAVLLVREARAANTNIDFTTNVTLTPSGVIDRIPPLTFSHDLYTHPDGIVQYTSGAYNYYGEEDELITFDAPVKLVSIDLTMPFETLPQPTHLHLRMLDSNDVLLAEVVEDPTGAVVTVPFDTGKVKKLVFHFEGGDPTFYGDGRTHAWYYIDNLVYDPDGCVTDNDCSPPTAACEADGSCGQCSATVSCAAPDQCHTNVCNLAMGQCSVSPAQDGLACNDGNGCTQVDTCQAGVCTGSSPVACPPPDECHDPGMCQDASGTCTNPNKTDGTACTGGSCVAGVCVPSTSASTTGSAVSSSAATTTTGATSGPSTTSAGPGSTGASGGSESSASGTGGSGDGSDKSSGCSCIAAGSDGDFPTSALFVMTALAGLTTHRLRRRRIAR